MNRDKLINRVLDKSTRWDILIIGGGATGLGVAVDAASRGYQTLLLEQDDFGKGTSSRSTKLVHGGVRYLQQGNVSLVLDALKERGLLRQNAPHLVHNQPFIVPIFDWWEGPFYGIGLRLYDILAGKLGFGESKNLSVDETIERLPNIARDGLRGGVIYHDGQFDDARLVINLAQTAVEQGAVVVNYVEVVDLVQENGFVRGVVAEEKESGETVELKAKVVVNATGPFTDAIRRMDVPDCEPMIKPSQGTHLVLDRSFLPGDTAIMVPHTDDGRVLFAIPWHHRVVVGTTDIELETTPLEPLPQEDEIRFLLEHAARYLDHDPTEQDVLSVFSGIRPLVSFGSRADKTAAISRDHTLHLSRSGLLTIAGGKWTTYRHMAEDTVDQAEVIAQLETGKCVTKNLNIHGYHHHSETYGVLETYGSDAPDMEELMRSNRGYDEILDEELGLRTGQVIWAARHEMARTVEDVLARRTRALLLNASRASALAPKVAKLLAKELKRSRKWEREQTLQFQKLASKYMI